MTLTRALAQSVVNVVKDDSACKHAIKPHPTLDAFDPAVTLALRFANLSGAARNLAMLAMLKGPGDPTFDERICIGISAVTIEAIHRAMKAGRLPGVRGCASAHRVRYGVHHDATSVRTDDSKEYIFDWHATLTPHDPAISRIDDWLEGRGATNFVFFSGLS
jgi:hypothetical protein